MTVMFLDSSSFLKRSAAFREFETAEFRALAVMMNGKPYEKHEEWRKHQENGKMPKNDEKW